MSVAQAARRYFNVRRITRRYCIIDVVFSGERFCDKYDIYCTVSRSPSPITLLSFLLLSFCPRQCYKETAPRFPLSNRRPGASSTMRYYSANSENRCERRQTRSSGTMAVFFVCARIRVFVRLSVTYARQRSDTVLSRSCTV